MRYVDHDRHVLVDRSLNQDSLTLTDVFAALSLHPAMRRDSQAQDDYSPPLNPVNHGKTAMPARYHRQLS